MKKFSWTILVIVVGLLTIPIHLLAIEVLSDEPQIVIEEVVVTATTTDEQIVLDDIILDEIMEVTEESEEVAVENNIPEPNAGEMFILGDAVEVLEEPVPTKTIHLQVETDTGTIFDDEVTFEACQVAETASSTFSAYCALNTADINTVWNFAWGPAYLTSISGVANDDMTGRYWLYFKNLEYGSNSYDQEILESGDSLLIEFNVNPLKISTASTTPAFGTTTISVFQFEFDDSWNGVWTASASSTLTSSLGDTYEIGASGIIDINIATTTPIVLYAEKDGYVTSNEITITAVADTPTVTPSADETGGGSNGPDTHDKPDLDKMLDFLDAHQLADGSFGADLYTDWVAIAYGSADGHDAEKNKLRSFLRSDLLDGNSATDYERRVMAMMSLGLNPYTDGDQNYIEKLVEEFDGEQIGDESIFNDDIFGIIALISAGYNDNDEIISKSAEFVISKQSDNGKWESVDLTSAAIQALSLVSSVDGADEAVSEGVNYVSGAQNNNGGFGNSFATSWAIQAFYADGTDPEKILNTNNNPFDYLYSLQEEDGGIDDIDASTNARIWATAYAIPAVQEKTWNEIMENFDKPVSEDDGTGASSENTEDNNIATTTPEVLGVATSTLPIEDEGVGFVDNVLLNENGENSYDGEVPLGDGGNSESSDDATASGTASLLSNDNFAGVGGASTPVPLLATGSFLILGGLGLIFYRLAL